MHVMQFLSTGSKRKTRRQGGRQGRGQRWKGGEVHRAQVPSYQVRERCEFFYFITGSVFPACQWPAGDYILYFRLFFIY
jgi:hypothetical protein